MPITINDVAQQAGISKSTVSRYLNGRYDCMSAATKERITQVIAELEYYPNDIARSLKQKSTRTIGAIVANILNPFSTSVIRGVEDYCKNAGFNVILCNADDDPVKEKEYIEMLMAKQIDGLIINTTGRNNELLQNVIQKIPLVLIDRKVPAIKSDVVTVDSFQGACLAVNHLFSLGHWEIAMFVLPYEDVSPRLERVQGYQAALANNGLPFRPEYLVETAVAEQAVTGKLQTLLAGPHKPTAVFGINNVMTMAIVKALKRLRCSIPQDMAVIGFDDWEWAELLEPAVSVIAQPTYQIGEKAASILIKRIKAKTVAPKKPSIKVYQPWLIARKSAGEI